MIFIPVSPSILPFYFGEEPVSSGAFVQAFCTVNDGDLPIEITWFLNEKPVTNVLGVSTSPAGRRGSIVTIESVQYEHAGNYSCRAQNKAGAAEYTVGLQVNGYCNFAYFFIASHYS